MAIEREVRYLVRSLDSDTFEYPSQEITQGYFFTPEYFSLRVRVSTNAEGVRSSTITKKSGYGIEREEDQVEVDHEVADFLLQTCPYQIKKTRYVRDGWEVDVLQDKLEGVILAEFEHEAGASVSLPAWIQDAIEVTDSVTNHHLAKTAHNLSGVPKFPMMETFGTTLPRIVITGGPCSGKTSLLRKLSEESGTDSLHGCQIKVVPEAATIVFGRLKVRPSDNPEDAANFQRNLYKVIRAFEDMSVVQALMEGVDAVVFDRGTLDGAAYMSSPEEFFRTIFSSSKREYRRYSGVIMMEVAPEPVYEQEKGSNPERTEDYKSALELQSRIGEVYKGHPRLKVISNSDYRSKMDEAIRAIISTIDGELL